MALAFNKSKGGFVKDRADSYQYKDGENRIRLVGDVLARYVYWIKGENNKSLPFENLEFNRQTEKFDKAEVNHVPEFYPDLKSSWGYAMQCIALDSCELRILNLKKKLMDQILSLAGDLALDPTDPENGFDVVFEKKKTGPLPINVEYSVKALKSKPRALSEKELELIKDLKSMDEILPRPTAEAQLALLQKLQTGSTDEGIDEDVDEEFTTT
jgi:hypothetical protein